MDFSSAQTWIILGVAVLILLGVIGHFGNRNGEAKPGSGLSGQKSSPAAAQGGLLTALSAAASNFDREMYIDDMTAEQLEDEHVWRTAFVTCYNIVWSIGDVREHHPGAKISESITGKPFDRQLAGLTEYYLDTAYDQMMAAGEDRYWDDELIALKDQWDSQKREQIILAALVTLEKAPEIHAAIRRSPHNPNDNGAHLTPYIDRVGEAFFGVQAPEKMASLREQAMQMASTIEI